jgi:hypothetical protein
MHAVVARVSIGDAEIVERGLREKVVPGVSNAPGLVAGYWNRSDDGRMLVFESEDAARTAADRFRGARYPLNGYGLALEVREVVATA